MGKIVKKKKKGRQSKLDLARQSGFRHTSHSDVPSESDLRRSISRRNVKYTGDDQVYEDDEEETEEEDDERREKKKKVKFVLRLAHGGVDPVMTRPGSSGGGGGRRGRSRKEGKMGRRRHQHQQSSGLETCVDVSASGSSSSEVYGDDDNKPFKKRRISGGGDDDWVHDIEEDGDDDEVRSIASEDQKKETQQNGDLKMMESGAGTPSNSQSRAWAPLQDNKQVELVLNKLQKKDKYGVYAEPVDPEELPDYYDVIEHPMDFGTIRKKLENGAYLNLEQLEADVLLLCSNAMQYNAPETIYFKQARAIQELSRKKFQRLRNDIKRIEADLKSEEKTKSNVVEKKPIKNSTWKTVQEPKSSCRIIQEPKSTCRTGQDTVGSDFSSGATLATTMEKCNVPSMTQACTYERPKNVDGLFDGCSSLAENKPEKAEKQVSGKGFLSKFGKKPFVLDENRRTTYNVSSQQLSKNESTSTIFEDEKKQLVAVGVDADHSYARSLARFAATLGPEAWKVASRRIEEALPAGFKFGRGWVGEYEPLPTAVLMLENNVEKHLITNLENRDKSWKNDQIKEGLKITEHEVPLSLRTVNSLGATVSSSMRSDNNVLQLAELNCSSPAFVGNKNIATRGKPVQSSDVITSRMIEMFSRNQNLVQPMPLKVPETDGVVSGGLANGKTVGYSSNNHNVTSYSSDFVSNIRNKAASYGNQDQALSDPVQMLRMLAGKAQKQQKFSNRSTVDASQVTPSVLSSRRDDSSCAGTTAKAHSWMTLGVTQSNTMDGPGSPKLQIAAPSPYQPSGEFRSVSVAREESPASAGLQWQLEKKMFPPQAYLQQPVHVGEEPKFQNNRPMFFPQIGRTDLSKFQVPSPWRGLTTHTQLNKKYDTLPPDLNIGFQSSGSPVKQSPGILLDSQQPDLALQL